MSDGCAARSSRAYKNRPAALRVRNKVSIVSSSACRSCVRHGRKASGGGEKKRAKEKKNIGRCNPSHGNQLVERSTYVINGRQ